MIILDGNNLLWRAHYAAPDLCTSDDRPTGALHNSLMMLAGLHRAFDRQPLVIAWDGRHSWRKEILPRYKSHRRDTEEKRKVRSQVYGQMEKLCEVLYCIGVAQLEYLHMEADDWAGVMCERMRLKKPDELIMLVSSDKDWFQLLEEERVVQVRSWKGSDIDLWTEKRVRRETGVDPKLWHIYQAIIGDPTDNIPKPKRRVGPKTALKWMFGAKPIELHFGPMELGVYQTNLEVTKIMRHMPYCMGSEVKLKDCWSWKDPMVDRESRKQRVLEIFEECELDAIRSYRRELFELATWK